MKSSASQLPMVAVLATALATLMIATFKVHAFMDTTHRQITKDVLSSQALWPMLTVNGKAYRFDRGQMNWIASWNAATDFGAPMGVHTNHCTSNLQTLREDLPGCANRIVLDRTTAVNQFADGIDDPEDEGGIKWLGRALHTTQDFCAHTNYPELLGIDQAPYQQTGYFTPMFGGADAVNAAVGHTNEAFAYCGLGEGTLDLSEHTITTAFATDGLTDTCTHPVPAGKCRHGGKNFWLSNPYSCAPSDCPGIAKDKPCQANYSLAKTCGQTGSQLLMQDLLQRLVTLGAGGGLTAQER